MDIRPCVAERLDDLTTAYKTIKRSCQAKTATPRYTTNVQQQNMKTDSINCKMVASARNGLVPLLIQLPVSQSIRVAVDSCLELTTQIALYTNTWKANEEDDIGRHLQCADYAKNKF